MTVTIKQVLLAIGDVDNDDEDVDNDNKDVDVYEDEGWNDDNDGDYDKCDYDGVYDDVDDELFR